MSVSVYLCLLFNASVKVNAVPPGWKVTAHWYRGDTQVHAGTEFPEATQDDRVIIYARKKNEAVTTTLTMLDAKDGVITTDFPEKATLEGEVRFAEGNALEGVQGTAGRKPPFDNPEQNAQFMKLSSSSFKVTNGRMSVTVPSKYEGEVRFGCVTQTYHPAKNPQISMMLPVGSVEARVEDEKGKPMKTFTATSMGVVLGGKAGHFKHAVLATCDGQIEISAKGHQTQVIPYKVEQGGALKLPTIIMHKK